MPTKSSPMPRDVRFNTPVKLLRGYWDVDAWIGNKSPMKCVFRIKNIHRTTKLKLRYVTSM